MASVAAGKDSRLVPIGPNIMVDQNAVSTRMTYCALVGRSRSHMTGVAMAGFPVAIVRLRTVSFVTGLAGILLVTNHAARAVERSLQTVSLLSPEVVVRSWHGVLVAFPARLAGVAHAACIVRLRAHRAMQARPVLAMTGWRRLPVHDGMTRGTIQPPAVRLLTNLHFLLVRQRRDLAQFLVHERTMAVQATVCQGTGMNEKLGG